MSRSGYNEEYYSEWDLIRYSRQALNTNQAIYFYLTFAVAVVSLGFLILANTGGLVLP